MSDSIGEVEEARPEPTPDEDEGDTEAAGTGEAGTAAQDGTGKRRRRRRRKKRETEEGVSSDEQAQLALEFLMDLVDELEMDCDVHLLRPREDAENDIVLEITGRDSGRIIGKKGQVLSAMQYLVNRVINRPGQDRRYVTVDAEGYRDRRDSSLATMAQNLGKQAVTQGKIITFEPMNPRDRRVVHMALAKFEGVMTRSDGEGDQRRVQIIPVRRGPAEE
jgi:spoIIIJ-associated protein